MLRGKLKGRATMRPTKNTARILNARKRRSDDPFTDGSGAAGRPARNVMNEKGIAADHGCDRTTPPVIGSTMPGSGAEHVGDAWYPRADEMSWSWGGRFMSLPCPNLATYSAGDSVAYNGARTGRGSSASAGSRKARCLASSCLRLPSSPSPNPQAVGHVACLITACRSVRSSTHERRASQPPRCPRYAPRPRRGDPERVRAGGQDRTQRVASGRASR